MSKGWVELNLILLYLVSIQFNVVFLTFCQDIVRIQYVMNVLCVFEKCIGDHFTEMNFGHANPS